MALRIGTAERGGTFWHQGLALKPALEREPLLRPVEVLATPGASVGNAERIAAGEIEFGFMAINWIGRAIRGEPPFARPIALRVAAPMNAGPLFFIVRDGAPIRTVGELAGRRVAVGLERSGMAQHAAAIFAALGMAVTPLHLDFAAGGDAVATGAADAQLQCPVPNPAMTALARRVALRVLPYDIGELERVLRAVPHYRRVEMPKGAIAGLDRAVAQPGVLNLLVTHARRDEAAVAAVARAVAHDAAALERAEPLFTGLAALNARLTNAGEAAFGDAPVHPGALAAWRANGGSR